MWSFNRNDTLCNHFAHAINRKADALEFPLQDRKVYGLAPERTEDIAVGTDMKQFVEAHGEWVREQFNLSMVVREDKPAHYIGIARKWRDQSEASIANRAVWVDRIRDVQKVLLLLAMWEGGRIVRTPVAQ